MKLGEAARNINAPVVYTPAHGEREDGRIVGVSGSYVFVHYRDSDSVKATRPEDLQFLRGGQS